MGGKGVLRRIIGALAWAFTPGGQSRRPAAQLLTEREEELDERCKAASEAGRWDEAAEIAMQLVRADGLEARITGLQSLARARLMLEDFDGTRDAIAHADSLISELRLSWGEEHPYPVGCASFIAELEYVLEARETIRPLTDEANDALDAHRFDEARRIFTDLRGRRSSDARMHGAHGLAHLDLVLGNMDALANRFEDLRDQVARYQAEFGVGDVYGTQWKAACTALETARLRYLRRFDEMYERANDAVRLDDRDDFLVNRAIALKHLGRLDEAISECRGIVKRATAKDLAGARYCLAGYLALAGHREESEAVHAEISPEDRERLAHDEVWLAACRGERERCLDLAEAALGGPGAAAARAYFAVEVELDRYRDDPRLPPRSPASAAD